MPKNERFEGRSDATLRALKDQIDKELNERKNAELHAFYQSETYERLSDKRKTLAKKGEKFVREFTVSIPIKFTIKIADVDGGSDALESWHLYAFCHDIEAKLDRKQAEFPKAMFSVVNEYIRRFADNACEEILGLVPKEIRAEFDDLEREYEDFLKEVKKAGVSLEDIDY